ncbi:ribosome biogenesis regulatory protein homolog [Drosophila grimshawi]|uniref:Ribosome biogenesis regulatory protein n=1 Tax=Drosophila grimshawi TaxID=7222 RepID=B4IXK7_DROGR|nr:ribosome biogenesis regulatory protein homolog [Drosophila grimshawi]EDV97469.1 GH14686 [Drosophila grimshawi]
MDVVKAVLEKHQKELDKYKPITVEKHLECRIDVGTLLITDPNDLEDRQIAKNKEEYLAELTRDNTQLLVNAIWELPTERVDESIVAKLPEPTTVLPRLRKPPGVRPMTKWEKFAKEKGITKKKKDKKTYDDVLDKWVPTYGFKHAEAEKDKEWVLEVPQNADPNTDMFQKKMDLRNEKVAKNEIQRMKNIVRAKKVEMPRSGYLGPEAASSNQLLTAVTVAKASTASVGKFQNKLPKEKEARGLGVKELIPGGKRKASHISAQPEREANLELIKSVLNKKPKLNVDKAISLQKQDERLEREAEAGNKPAKKKGKGSRKAVGKKPKGHQGQRAPGKKGQAGRKRR